MWKQHLSWLLRPDEEAVRAELSESRKENRGLKAENRRLRLSVDGLDSAAVEGEVARKAQVDTLTVQLRERVREIESLESTLAVRETEIKELSLLIAKFHAIQEKEIQIATFQSQVAKLPASQLRTLGGGQ